MSKVPKDLEMNPLSYRLIARVVDKKDVSEAANIEVHLEAQDSYLTGYINKNEAIALSKWFAQLAKAIK